VREACRTHLQPLGFKLTTGKQDIVGLESANCRIYFQPHSVFPVIQRTDKDPSLAHRAYGLHVILKASGVEEEFQLTPFEGPETVEADIDRMVRLLVERCRPVLDGDETAWEGVTQVAAEDDDHAFEQLSKLGIRLKEDGRWRELPELESVRANSGNRLARAALALALLVVPVLAIIGTVAGVYVLLSNHEQTEDPYLIAFILALLGAMSVTVSIFIVSRVARAQYHWQTTPDGLTVTGFRKKQFVRWDEIETVGVMPGAGYEFRTAQDRIRLDKAALQDTAMEASIWQHLNRAGKSEDIILSDFAMSLWAEIPEEKTASTQWESPIPMHLSDILLRFVALEALIWAVAYRLGLDPIGVGIVVSWWPVAWLVPRLITIKRVSVDNDRVSAVTALGKRAIAWTDARSVKFVNPGIRQPASLQIRGSCLKFIRIPWIPDHPNSTRVMLTILRRLRQQPRFRLLPFPTVLLTAGQIED
jgi:hypothetical protein